MRIAVSYSDGEIFQHFGKTEEFKIYTVENGQVISTDNIPVEGSGHDALAEFLTMAEADVVICGGIGEGAQAALGEAGIEICAGVSGDADEAVEAYLNGELQNTDGECAGGEGCGCEGGCESESGCGGCGGGCGGCGRPTVTGANVGKTCRVHYRGTFNNGEQFDSSYDRGEPLEFICGAGMMIHGFDAAVANMEVGQEIDIHLMPEEAYGEADPDAIITLSTAQLPGSEELAIGARVYLMNNYGQRFPVTVVAKEDGNITFDANHEMAGKELNFHIELVELL